jgi:alcohol dehydrogenase class IV
MMHFELATAARILFGAGKIKELPAIAAGFGRRGLLVTGRNPERAVPLRREMEMAGVSCLIFPVAGEPTLAMVREGVRACRDGCQFVISVGGGSVIDAGKAIAALAPNSGEPLDYLEVIGNGQQLQDAPLPFMAVPTTAGTGAEVTRNAVLGSPEHGLKASLRHPSMLAKVAVVDAELTYDLPPSLTANTGLDALTQVIEPFVSCRANPLVDLFCREGMQRVAGSLLAAYKNGDRPARESMAFASLLGGLSLANAGLGVVHGMAAPLGGMLSAPHGAICAALLPAAIAVNVQALRKRAAGNPALAKYEEMARILTGNGQAQAEDAAKWTTELCQKLAVSSLTELGLNREQIPGLVEKVRKASSMKANPLPLTDSEITEIAEHSLRI